MSHWKTPLNADALNAWSKNTLAASLGIRFVGIRGDALVLTMPVDHRTHQPFGLLHGGASIALAETAGSAAGMMCLDMDKQYVVGLEVNGNHLLPLKSGTVTAHARPQHLGGSVQVWEIRITDERERLVCLARLTLAVRDRKPEDSLGLKSSH